MQPTIGVVIPTWNAQSFIGETLDTVASQSLQPSRVVVVDDGSTDRTIEQVREWSASHNYPVDIIEQPNQGVSKARNTGILSLKTDLIALLDADDLWLPTHLHQLHRAFAVWNDIVLSFGDGETFTSTGVVNHGFFPRSDLLQVPYDLGPGDVRKMQVSAYSSLVKGCYIGPSSALFSRSVALAAGLFDENVWTAEDQEFFLRLSKAGTFAYVPTCVSRIRRHDQNKTHRRNALRHMKTRLRFLHDLRASAAKLFLTQTELARTQCAIDEMMQLVLYYSSRRGLRCYFATFRELAKCQIVVPIWRPRHFVRSVIYSIAGIPE